MKPESSKKGRKKSPRDYPVMVFRPSASDKQRIAGLAEAAGMSKGQVINVCIRNYLSVLEERHGVKAVCSDAPGPIFVALPLAKLVLPERISGGFPGQVSQQRILNDCCLGSALAGAGLFQLVGNVGTQPENSRNLVVGFLWTTHAVEVFTCIYQNAQQKRLPCIYKYAI